MKLRIKQGQHLYVTSDTHYHHKNICRSTTSWTNAEKVTRDFPSLNAMDDFIVNSINGRVGKDDILLHLGDWSFGGFEYIKEFSDRIECNEIHLFLGNHDHHIARNKDDSKRLFTSVNTYSDIEIEFEDAMRNKLFGKPKFTAFHYPMASWNGMNRGVIQLHGHVHLHADNKLAAGKAIDVGCDGNNMTPYSIQEILSLMDKRPIKTLSLPKDHHETDIR